jgi:hypothetical protein
MWRRMHIYDNVTELFLERENFQPKKFAQKIKTQILL